MAAPTDQYEFLCSPRHSEWLAPHIELPCTIREWDPLVRSRFGRVLGRLDDLRRRLRRDTMVGAYAPLHQVSLSRARGRYDVAHFPYQRAFLTDIPSIYHPWDLQHLHLPQYFSDEEVDRRERNYRSFCNAASLVVAATDWQRRDFIHHYSLSPEKVVTIEPAVARMADSRARMDVAEVRGKYSLPEVFALYPAHYWPHKNHRRLIDAIAILAAKGRGDIHLVMTAHPGERPIMEYAQQQNVGHLVHLCGRTAAAEMPALYEEARLLVFPSEFEGFGLPLVEAMQVGLPIVASHVCGIPDLVGGAGHFFDPTDTGAIAAAIEFGWDDAAFRRRAATEGVERSASYEPAAAALRMRGVYQGALALARGRTRAVA